MKGFCQNIEKETLENNNFRKVLYTGKHSQLVLMSLKPKEEIGMEVHTDYTIYSPAHHKDQIVRITKEEAMANEENFDGTTTE